MAGRKARSLGRGAERGLPDCEDGEGCSEGRGLRQVGKGWPLERNRRLLGGNMRRWGRGDVRRDREGQCGKGVPGRREA